MTTVEDLREEVVGEMQTLTKDNLITICDLLKISGQANVSGKTRLSLLTHILKHLERDEIEELDDEGMAELLILKDKVAEITKGTNNEEAEPAEQNISGQDTGDENSSETSQPMENTTSAARGTVANAQRQMIPSNVPQQPNHYWQKDFKISGQIGEPGQKDKLTFSSLAHQIENGLSRGYAEIDIVDAVIRAISPGLQLRSYLEGKVQLTLPTLRRILRSHFQEKSATELYKQLASEVQHTRESAQSFLMRVLDLKQKVLFASQESESGLKYDPALVQRMCLHTILTGLQSDSVRIDMQPLLLDSDTPDELLLERINTACANETERRNKKRCLASQSAVNASAVQSEDTLPSKAPVKEVKAKIPPELLHELAELKTGVASLKGLSVEIAHIKETLQQPIVTPQPFSQPPPVMQQHQQYYGYQGPHQRPAPAPLHYPAQRYTSRPARLQRRCHVCQQMGANEHCTHCYTCGSGEHFQAGCKNRAARPPKEGPLNQRWLPLRDEC